MVIGIKKAGHSYMSFTERKMLEKGKIGKDKRFVKFLQGIWSLAFAFLPGEETIRTIGGPASL